MQVALCRRDIFNKRATIDTGYFILNKVKDGFTEWFEQLKANSSLLAFIVWQMRSTLSHFFFDAGSLQMQSFDLCTKHFFNYLN